MTPLEQRIGYKFRNSLLLAEALTHPSLSYETQRHHFDNQRLEFLGDAVLQLICTEHLYNLFPNCPEGQLTKMRARLVSREGLKVHAISIGIGRFLMMGKGEEASGGRVRASVLADAFEALVGAMYLDGGLEPVRIFVLKEAQPDIENLRLEPLDVNPKGKLQEILQAIAPQSPEYSIIEQSGPEHLKSFVARVEWRSVELGVGEGNSKKEAHIAAALDALQREVWKNESDESSAEHKRTESGEVSAQAVESGE